MSSLVENCADNTARAAGLLAVERPGGDLEDDRLGERRTGRLIEHCCIMHVSWLAELAESQPQVLKWAPVCSESDVM